MALQKEKIELKKENVSKIEIEKNSLWVYKQGVDAPQTHNLQGKLILGLNDNFLRKVPSLKECSQITFLDIGNNLIKRLSYLPPLLTQFCCAHNCLKELPPLPETLQGLHCGDNLFKELEVVAPNLLSFSCSNGRLRSLIVKAKTLKMIWCTSNKLTNLIVESEECLQLECADNKLTSFSIPDRLETLICQANELKSIPRLPNGLVTLNLYNNPLIFVPFLPKRPRFVTFSGDARKFHSKENYDANYKIQNMIRTLAMVVFEECGLINDFLRDELFGLFVG